MRKRILIITIFMLLVSNISAQYAELNPKLEWVISDQPLNNMVISPDSKILIVYEQGNSVWSYDKNAYYKGSVKFIEIETGKVISRFQPCDGGKFGVSDFDGEGNIWAVACSSGKVEIWDFFKARRLKSLTSVNGFEIKVLHVNSPGTRIATLEYLKESVSYRAGLWDVESGDFISYLDPSNQSFGESGKLKRTFDEVKFFKFSHDGSSLAVAYLGSSILWNAETAKPISNLGIGDKSGDFDADFKFSQDDSILVVGTFKGIFRVYHIPSSKLTAVLKPGGGKRFTSNITEDGKYVVTSYQDKTVRFWRVGDEKLMWKIKLDHFPIDLVFYPFDNLLFIGGKSDYGASIVNIKNGEILWVDEDFWIVSNNYKFLVGYNKKKKQLRMFRLN